jgi:hypothetical protein
MNENILKGYDWVYDNRDYWVFGLCPLSDILKGNTKEHNVSETASVSVLRRVSGRHPLCWVRQKELMVRRSSGGDYLCLTDPNNVGVSHSLI